MFIMKRGNVFMWTVYKDGRSECDVELTYHPDDVKMFAELIMEEFNKGNLTDKDDMKSMEKKRQPMK